jgi:hypothetical protein
MFLNLQFLENALLNETLTVILFKNTLLPTKSHDQTGL